MSFLAPADGYNKSAMAIQLGMQAANTSYQSGSVAVANKLPNSPSNLRTLMQDIHQENQSFDAKMALARKEAKRDNDQLMSRSG